MILIFSKDKHESTVEDVMDWLSFYNQKYKRVNNILSLKIEDDFNEVNSVWAWRPGRQYNKFEVDSIKNLRNLNRNIENENRAKSNFLFYKLRDKYWLSHPKKALVNKLIILDKAKKIGLKQPEFIFTNEKKELIKFKEKYSRVITKSIDNSYPLNDKERYVMFYTKEITEIHIQALPNYFEGSFFQEYIEKKIEIRVFYLNEKIYSMAIMIPNDEIDHRKISRELRKVPYQLQSEIEDKIKQLMQDLDLNTASIDLMCDAEDNIYFLEVNPVGQFGMVSNPCNYYLEKEVAINLI